MSSALTADDLAPAPSVLRTVWGSPLYRGATVSLFLSGLGTSAAAPQITLFLVDDLHVSLTTAGLYYLTSLTAPLAGYLVGARSDRSGNRLGLFRVCTVLGFLGWIAMAAADRAWMPFAVNAVLLAFSLAAGSQLFAAVHDDLRYADGAAADGVVSTIRMALTAGWIIGPVLGSLLAASTGPRALLVGTGLLTLAQMLPLGLTRSGAPTRPVADIAAEEAAAAAVTGEDHESERVHRPGLRRMLPLLAFTGLFLLVYAGEPIKYGYLPIYMRDQLHLPTGVSGAVIGIQPLIELCLMPAAVIAARRIGMLRLMIVGAALAIGADLCFALTGDAVGMFAGQILMGGVWGVFAALGIIVAQRLLPEAVATASAVYITSTAIANAFGGATGSLGVATLGLPHVFLFSALYAAIATVGMAALSRSRHAHAADARPAG